MKHTNQSGHSLIEILLALSLTGILATGSMHGYQTYNRFTLQQTDILDMQREIKIASHEISRLIGLAGYGLEPRFALASLSNNKLDMMMLDPEHKYCANTDTTRIILYSTQNNQLIKEAYCNGTLMVSSISHIPFQGTFSFSYKDKFDQSIHSSELVHIIEISLKSVRFRDCYADTIHRTLAMKLAPRNILL